VRAAAAAAAAEGRRRVRRARELAGRALVPGASSQARARELLAESIEGLQRRRAETERGREELSRLRVEQAALGRPARHMVLDPDRLMRPRSRDSDSEWVESDPGAASAGLVFSPDRLPAMGLGFASLFAPRPEEVAAARRARAAAAARENPIDALAERAVRRALARSAAEAAAAAREAPAPPRRPCRPRKLPRRLRKWLLPGRSALLCPVGLRRAR